jgi:N-carbamoyl-L-amino-acid hydrolase
MVLARSINRRELVSGLAVATVAAAFPGLVFPQGSDSGWRVNPDRLRESMEGLSVYGRPVGGTFADGVTRDGFSDACVAGRNYATQLLRAFGMEPHVDPASNIFGSRAGSDQSLKRSFLAHILIRCPSGSNVDGDLGSMSAIEVMHTLKEHGVTTRHPLQMVIWTDEQLTEATKRRV